MELADLTSTNDPQPVLALWNDFHQCRKAYNRWHVREHVRERLSVSGFLRARRYVRTDGPLPEYLTVYDLDSLQSLKGPDYLHLLDNPTKASVQMRPGFTNLIRRGCDPIGRVGRGTSGKMATTIIKLDKFRISDFDDLLRIYDEAHCCAVTLYRFDDSIDHLPFDLGSETPRVDVGDGVLFAEYFSSQALDLNNESAVRIIGQPCEWTSYELAYLATKQDALHRDSEKWRP